MHVGDDSKKLENIKDAQITELDMFYPSQISFFRGMYIALKIVGGIADHSVDNALDFPDKLDLYASSKFIYLQRGDIYTVKWMHETSAVSIDIRSPIIWRFCILETTSEILEML